MQSDNFETRSFSARAADLLAAAMENHALIRILALIAVAWVWLTLLGFTLSLSREVASASLARSAGLYLGSSDNRTALAIAATAVTVIASLLIIPVVLVWNYLVRLTRLLAHLAAKLVRWDPQEEAHEALIILIQEGLGEAINVFMRWFSLFVLTWVLILIVNALGAIIALVLQLIASL